MGGWLSISGDVAHLQAAKIIADRDWTVGVGEVLLAVWGASAEHRCHRWRRLVDQPGRMLSIGLRILIGGIWHYFSDCAVAVYTLRKRSLWGERGRQSALNDCAGQYEAIMDGWPSGLRQRS